MKTSNVVLLTLVVCFTLAAPASAAPATPPWGLHLDYIDRSVKPGEDFNRYANGRWLETAQIPADRASAGACPVKLPAWQCPSPRRVE